jgi:hypothetical protein
MFSISRCSIYQLWGFFKQKFIKLVAVIAYARLERKIGSLRKLSQFNITKVPVLCIETKNSFFHLYRCDYSYNRIDATHLATSTPELDDDLIVLYLGYYD